MAHDERALDINPDREKDGMTTPINTSKELAQPVDTATEGAQSAPSIEDIARAYFEHGPDGYPGRYDQVAEHIKVRNRPRFEAIAALWQAPK